MGWDGPFYGTKGRGGIEYLAACPSPDFPYKKQNHRTDLVFFVFLLFSSRGLHRWSGSFLFLHFSDRGVVEDEIPEIAIFLDNACALL